MATNKFLPFAAGDDANVMSDADYANALATNGALEKGVTTGQASSKQANKTWRQATLMAAAVAQVIVDFGEDANDALTQEQLAALIRKALLTQIAADARYVASSASDTGPRVDSAGVNTANGQPWLYSQATFYNLIFSDEAAGAQALKSAGLNTNTANDFFPWLITRSGVFYNLATREWANNRFQTSGDFATNARVSSYFVGSNNNATVTNLQGVNWSAGNTSGYLQVAANGTTLALPTSDNVTNAVSALVAKSTASSDYTVRYVGVQQASGQIAVGYTNASGGLSIAFAQPAGSYQAAGDYALVSQLPLPVGDHEQSFTTTIPNPAPADGWVVSIPTAFTTLKTALVSDTGANCYCMSVKIENNAQVRLFAKYPGGAAAGGGVASVAVKGSY